MKAVGAGCPLCVVGVVCQRPAGGMAVSPATRPPLINR
ncbi:hypothetical protein BN135_181 [Cronobacter muytjensii 530]